MASPRRHGTEQPTVVSVSTVPVSPAQDRHRREKQYTLAMAFRLVCIGLIFVVPGLWRIPLVVGAVLLPWIAVMLANNTNHQAQTRVDPGQQALTARKEPLRHTGDVLREHDELENTR